MHRGVVQNTLELQQESPTGDFNWATNFQGEIVAPQTQATRLVAGSIVPFQIPPLWIKISKWAILSKKQYYIIFYKITKIARALWLAERSVYMRVSKHGCGIKMFCFSRANQASTNLKKFLSSKLDKFTLFTHSFVGWNLENRYKESVSVFFFRLSWHFQQIVKKNPKTYSS